MLSILKVDNNLLREQDMDTKTFVNQLSQITESLLAMTPAQREIVHQAIQTSQAEIIVNEMIQPMFDHLSQCPHCHSTNFKKWGKAKEGELTMYWGY